MHNIVRLPQKSRMDKTIDALFQVLPASSHKEIASKLSRELGRRVAETDIGCLLLHLRRNSEKYGWTVPHAKKGIISKEDKHAPRFFHVLVEKGRDPEFDSGHEAQLNNGVISTVCHVATSLQNESDALSAAAQYLKSHSARKWTKSLARRTNQIADDAKEIVQMLGDEDVA